MEKLSRFSCVIIGLLLASTSCSPVKQSVHAAATASADSLRLIGQYEIPLNFSFDNTVVGGLSGVDYDPDEQVYYLISDDRSFVNPARFYKANIQLSSTGIDTVSFTSVSFLQRPDGGTYLPFKQDKLNAPDPEAIRFYRPARQLVWSNEGERILKAPDTILQKPFIHFMTTAGAYLSNFTIPKNIFPNVVEKGSRQNGVFEGLTFADDYTTLVACMEEPLFEDGPRASFSGSAAITRILKFDVKTRGQIAQYAYRLSPVAKEPLPAGAYSINGISDILEAGPGNLFVVERSFSTGSPHCTIRVFLTSLSSATDIRDQPSLQTATGFKEASKKLLLNMDSLGIYTDNIEAVCYGPTLPNGHKTLLFVSDNNFNPMQKTQFLLFEIL
ncbi:MAG: esterase-like activity of phytase family protein [Ferruginibacter sp.]|nr:esterase-like activity of phytase family protein [Ferruginibacter sp.]